MGNLFAKDNNEKKYAESKTGGEGEDKPDLVPVTEEPVKIKSVVRLQSINVKAESHDVADYCLPLVETGFHGQTTVSGTGDADKGVVTNEVLNLGKCLSMLDDYLKRHENVTDVTGKEEEFLQLLKLAARKRRNQQQCEEKKKCFQRLLLDSERFIRIYHARGIKSEICEHESYWGSRQQLLSGKVIADWVDRENGPLDPIFGVLLQPTSGRVGPGDTGWFHDLLFDDRGHMAYHSAVHDAFGYLLCHHTTGPGYDYLQGSYFATDNPMAGQLGGIDFWKKVLNKAGGRKICEEYV